MCCRMDAVAWHTSLHSNAVLVSELWTKTASAACGQTIGSARTQGSSRVHMELVSAALCLKTTWQAALVLSLLHFLVSAMDTQYVPVSSVHAIALWSFLQMHGERSPLLGRDPSLMEHGKAVMPSAVDAVPGILLQKLTEEVQKRPEAAEHVLLPHLHEAPFAAEPSVVSQGGWEQVLVAATHRRPEAAVHSVTPHVHAAPLAAEPSDMRQSGMATSEH